MPNIMVQCGNCQRIFNSSMFMGAGSSVTLINNKSQCTFCGSMENIPDGIFTATVNEFVDILRGSKNPLQEALDIYDSLKNVKSYDDLSSVLYGDKIEQFLKRNKVKIGVGIAIIKVLIDLLNTQPGTEINNNIINQQFYNQYNNQIINIEL